MTDSQGGEAAVVETTAGADAPAERDFEAEARKAGWKPQEEFSGDKGRWKDARAWVEYGELRDNIRKEMSAEYEGRFAKLEKMSKRAQDAIKNGYESQIADLKAQKTAAVKAGNVAAVEQLDKAIDATKEAASSEGESPIEEADINAAFMKRNPWYGDDDDLTAQAIILSNAVSQAYTLKHKKPMPDDLMLEAVEKKIKTTPEYREKFPDKAANAHAAVDGGSDSPGGAGPAKSPLFSKLPLEAKKMFDADVKAGTYKASEREEWAQAYLT
jgi:hypothetical protein